MPEPTAITVVGDSHGNFKYLNYMIELAMLNESQAIVQAGDFGYWAHTDKGKKFLDQVSEAATQYEIPIYWIDGNHENHTMLRGEESKFPKTIEGFWTIRPNIHYIPRGTRWTWNGMDIMGLGGAYSVDKDWRLESEQLVNQNRVSMGLKPHPYHTMWWPEEEITDDEVARATADPKRLDLLITHDKPRASSPRWNRKDFPECYPNQDKIQEVCRELRPRVLIHGHLHYRYEDTIRVTDEDSTQVYGLASDQDNWDDAQLKVQLSRSVDNQ